MVPKIGDKVQFNNEWLDLVKRHTSLYEVFRGKQLVVKKVSVDSNNKTTIEFEGYTKVILLESDGMANNSHYHPELKGRHPLDHADSGTIDIEVCKKCGGMGQRFPMCCRCSKCGEIIWGI